MMYTKACRGRLLPSSWMASISLTCCSGRLQTAPLTLTRPLRIASRLSLRVHCAASARYLSRRIGSPSLVACGRGGFRAEGRAGGAPPLSVFFIVPYFLRFGNSIHFILQPQDIVRADAIVPAQGDQVPDGQLVGAPLVAGVHGLGCAQHLGDLPLGLVAVLPQVADTLDILHALSSPFHTGQTKYRLIKIFTIDFSK